MKISISADHVGFAVKEHLRQKLLADGHEVTDCGTDSDASCDYPAFAAAVARNVAHGVSDRGVLVCGSGVGMQIAANKISGVRAAVGTSEDQVRLTRAHNDLNVLTLGARTLDSAAAERLLDAFLAAGFDGGRHTPRIAQIAALEHTQQDGEK